VSSSGEFGFETGGVIEKMSHLWPHVEVLSKYFEVADARHEKSVNDAYTNIGERVQNLMQHKLKKSIFQS